MLAATALAACAHTAPTTVPSEWPFPPPPEVEPAPSPEVATERIPAPQEGLGIVVSKSERWLAVYLDGEELHRYRVGLGFRPQGPKRWEGDGRTPEGQYAIAMKNPRSRYFLSLGLNYPAPPDASRGYSEGRITWDEYRAIEFAFEDGQVPPWDTPLGGEIFIHGHGAASDWTKGCIALNDADMRELYRLVEVGTPVTILP